MRQRLLQCSVVRRSSQKAKRRRDPPLCWHYTGYASKDNLLNKAVRSSSASNTTFPRVPKPQKQRMDFRSAFRNTSRCARVVTPLSTARRLTLFLALVVASTGNAPRLSAQPIRPTWRVTAEVGGVLGGIWLKGSAAPTVRTDPGPTIGVGAQRMVAQNISAGASVKVGAQPVSVRENGASWSGGTLTEADAVGTVSFLAPQSTPLRPSLDLAAGIAVLSGARTLLPFRDASRVAPIGEAGVTLRRVDPNPVKQELSLFVHYGVLRLDASAADASTISGWVSRISAGVRVTR